MSGVYLIVLIVVWTWVTRLLWKGGRRFLEASFANRSVRMVLVVIVGALWFGGAFWEVTGKKMYWDAKVRELCAKDGGVKVYETVELPPERFNRWGQINFEKPTLGENSLGKEYLVKNETNYLRSENMQPTILRHHYQIFQADGRLLGERISYTRRGGDLPGPWHSSSFSCPDYRTGGLLDVLFIKTSSKGDK